MVNPVPYQEGGIAAGTHRVGTCDRKTLQLFCRIQKGGRKRKKRSSMRIEKKENCADAFDHRFPPCRGDYPLVSYC